MSTRRTLRKRCVKEQVAFMVIGALLYMLEVKHRVGGRKPSSKRLVTLSKWQRALHYRGNLFQHTTNAVCHVGQTESVPAGEGVVRTDRLP